MSYRCWVEQCQRPATLVRVFRGHLSCDLHREVYDRLYGDQPFALPVTYEVMRGMVSGESVDEWTPLAERLKVP